MEKTGTAMTEEAQNFCTAVLKTRHCGSTLVALRKRKPRRWCAPDLGT